MFNRLTVTFSNAFEVVSYTLCIFMLMIICVDIMTFISTSVLTAVSYIETR